MVSRCTMNKVVKYKKTTQSQNHVSFGDLAKIEATRNPFEGREIPKRGKGYRLVGKVKPVEVKATACHLTDQQLALHRMYVNTNIPSPFAKHFK